MKTTNSLTKEWLHITANTVADQLRARRAGTRLYIPRVVMVPTPTDTDGWMAEIGNLGKKQPQLGIWLDRFTGHRDLKLYVGFFSKETKQITSIIKRVSRNLWPVRKLREADIERGDFTVMKRRLARGEFNAPVLETYAESGKAFLGIFDSTRPTTATNNPRFCERAVEFFLDVAHSLPGAKSRKVEPDAYLRCENRKWVKAHFGRERSGLLATDCKKRDGYVCKVCGASFAKIYGEALGATFAEAHHLKPLGQQGNKVRTELDDLVTVCANCHRMLHRMDGKPEDVKKLRAIVEKRGGKRS